MGFAVEFFTLVDAVPDQAPSTHEDYIRSLAWLQCNLHIQ